jgi:hypothetical protein
MDLESIVVEEDCVLRVQTVFEVLSLENSFELSEELE